MTPNYYLEYRFIPSLIEEVKNERMPLQALIDIEWIKETLTNNNVEINWEGFSIDLYDSKFNKTSLENGKFIAYSFPAITISPEAKYGVIDIDSRKYYTFESCFEDGCWVIGSQDIKTHSHIRMIKKELSLEEFIKSISQPDAPPSGKWEQYIVCILVLLVTIMLIILSYLKQ